MLSKAQIKYIRSLTQQKYRKEHNVFLAEGDKIAAEWLGSNANIRMVVALEDWAAKHEQLLKKHPETSLHIVTPSILELVSALQTPNQVLLVIDIPGQQQTLPDREWSIALDGIQDPGNMGTIIRIADWFGIRHIIASPETVDFYNPKVVQAAMGSHLRISFHKSDLGAFLDTAEVPIFAATLHGKSVYEMKPAEAAMLVIGNEGKGIDSLLIAKATHPVTIPRRGGAESLNAAVSTGILCSLLVPPEAF
jgi:TrmH family RNA methyltransferase